MSHLKFKSSIHLLCLVGILLTCANHADAAWRWPWQKGEATDASNLPPVDDNPRIKIAALEGASGSSAGDALRKELLTAREFYVVKGDETAEYTVSGRSVGGKVDAKLVNAAGKTLFERTYAAPGLDENIKALADDLIYTVTGKPGLATSRITFVSDITGRKQIHICDSEGQNIQQLTRHRFGAVSPALASDGTMLAFTSYRTGFPAVVLMDLTGGWERVITDTPGASFGASFSPEGSRLAMIMSFLGNPELFISDLNTNSASCLSETTGVPSSPSWHPDGKRLIFSLDEGKGPRLFVADLGEKENTTTLFQWNCGYRYATDPEWSPDGKKVVFTARTRGKLSVVVRDYPNGRSQVIAGDARHPSWSANGRFLVYIQNGDLYRHDLQTGHRKALITNFGEISEPNWMK
ncbi:MAG: PD40 domain-containing protein [Verrucomicrobiales bacterium]|nr:PD40 domain-containing protein [Verrucomicrobiales bacterium]MCP5556699.1 PD40 domain-containing protein [Verrucomicrobiaceae bacterium]